MSARLKRSLPFVAVVGLLVGLGCLALLLTGRQSLLVDTGETLAALESTVLAALRSLRPESIDDPAIGEVIAQAEEGPYVAAVWVFTPDGEIVKGALSTMVGSTVDAWATDETHRVLGTVPQDGLNDQQRVELMAASTMQREGEHNDVFRHLLREVRGPGGELVALVGITYDVSPGVGGPPDVVYLLSLAGWLVGMAAYWLSLPVWVWVDARERGERAWVWASFVLLGNLVALMAYILARVPRGGQTVGG